MKKLFTLMLIVLLAAPSFAQNVPTAVDDYSVTTRGLVSVDVCANDYDIDGDAFKILMILGKPRHGLASKLNDSVIGYRVFPDFAGGSDTLLYMIRDNSASNMVDTAMLVLTVDNSFCYDSISANNIKTGVNADGFMFTKLAKLYYGDIKEFIPLFEAPQGQGLHTIFSGSVWIAGLDVSDGLHVAAQRYYGSGQDFWAGPVSNVYDSVYDAKYDRVWKVTKADIDDHLAHCWTAGYVPAPAIADWPGNGDASQGQFPFLAPFHDWGGDGTYQPEFGDFPLFPGDEAVFFMFNDDRGIHTETNGQKLGVEFKGMLYAFDCPDDSALWNTVFLSMEVINRSTMTYHDVYLGSFMDFDIGEPWDDFTGCDVQRGSYYCYNGKNIDGIGNPGAYGSHPPVQSVTFLAGPLMNPDGLDNPSGNCDESINGVNFGNSVVDDERLGLVSFAAFSNIGSPGPTTDPDSASEVYNYLNGLWKDGSAMHYWGAGHPSSGGTGPICSFMYPGASDSCNWGTQGVDPGIVDPWTEAQAGNAPYDRRGLGVSGPFTLNPDQSYWLDLAFVFARNFSDTNATAAIPIMQQRIDSIRSYYNKDMTPCGGGFSVIKPQKVQNEGLKLYPNPSDGMISLEYPVGANYRYEIFDVTGNLLKSDALNSAGSSQLDLSGLRSGLYVIRVCADGKCLHTRFILQ